jgi:tRNA1Val (adenine37-N6)-methyltransferase
LAPTEVSRDALFGGSVELLQPARGYRVNVDSLLLAAFASQRRVRRLVDLGGGVGALALAIDHLVGVAQAVLIEREAELAELARENLARARLASEVYVAEVGPRLPRGLAASADLVVCNPPFFDTRSARASRDPAAARARFGALEPFLVAAGKALAGSRARAAFCYPARSLPELVAGAASVGLVPKRLRLVHPSLGEPARLALVELRRARPGGLSVEPPLLEWSAPGVRSDELSALLARKAAGRRGSPPPRAR